MPCARGDTLSVRQAERRLHPPTQVRLLLLAITLVPLTARTEPELPGPLRVEQVVALAREHRSEVLASRARLRAAAQRPAIVSALDEPVVSASLDHLPFALHGVDASLTVEQTFPLSRVRGHRERAAQADVRRERANTQRVELDVELDAAEAFWMLAQIRANAEITQKQHGLAEQLVAAALARYSTNTGAQSDVLRAQVDVARFDAERRALAAEIRGAEIMLNTSLARDVDASVPELDTTVSDAAPPTPEHIERAARTQRPELRAGRAEVERAEADVRVMRSMYAPMAMIRTGPAYTMTDGPGWMVMVGISVPIWRGKLRAGVAEARAMVDMTTADLDAMRRMVDGEARGARETIVATRERYVALRDTIVPLAQRAIAPTLAAYAAGQVPLVSVIEMTQALWSSERELVAARYELGMAWARLSRASGEETRR